MNQTYRDKCILDLKAKILLDKGTPYVPGGIPWRYEMGSGGYWNELLETGLSVSDLTRLASEPVRFGKESINEDTPYGASNKP